MNVLFGPVSALCNRNGTFFPEVEAPIVSSSSQSFPPLCALLIAVHAEKSQSAQTSQKPFWDLSVSPFFVAAAAVVPADAALCPIPFSVHSPVLVDFQMLAARPDLLDSQWLVAVLQLGHEHSLC